MTEAPLQPAPATLRTDEIYQTFIALCVDSDGVFETACAAAAVRGFEPFDQDVPLNVGAERVKAQARFRRPGYFFTASKLLAETVSRRSRNIQSFSLVARPASFLQLKEALAADLRSPTATNATPGVEYVFIGDPRNSPALKSRIEGDQGFEKGQGDLVMITAFEVRKNPGVPGDAVGLTYQRWTA